MSMNKQKGKYVAGAYAKHRPDALMLAMQYIEDLEKKQPKRKGVETVKIAPATSISPAKFTKLIMVGRITRR